MRKDDPKPLSTDNNVLVTNGLKAPPPFKIKLSSDSEKTN